VFVALLMSLCNPRFSATQYALLSGVYALSRSILSAPAGVVAERVGWPSFFLFTVAASVPGFVLLGRLAPWGEQEARGAFDPRRETPDLTLALGADNVDVGALLARLGVAEGFNARADALRLELIGRGERLSELARRSSFRATLAGGTLDLRNPGGKPLAQIAISEVVAGAEGGEPVRVAIDGRIGKTPVKIGVASGTLAAFLENREYVPFKVDAEAAGTRMNVNGRMALPLAAGRGDLTLVLSGDRLDSLDTLAQTELPTWCPWSLSGPVLATRDAY
jgi:hypothetical protein